MNKKGLSPVIASVLLIALVLVLATIIYLWARAFIPEVIEKDGSRIENSCPNVVFDASYSGGFLRVQNNGNVPIYGVKYGVEGVGTLAYYEKKQPIVTGGSVNFEITNQLSLDDKIRVIPLLLGKTSAGELRAFACDEMVKMLTV